jgi:hypothetical protein
MDAEMAEQPSRLAALLARAADLTVCLDAGHERAVQLGRDPNQPTGLRKVTAT